MLSPFHSKRQCNHLPQLTPFNFSSIQPDSPPVPTPTNHHTDSSLLTNQNCLFNNTQKHPTVKDIHNSTSNDLSSTADINNHTNMSRGKRSSDLVNASQRPIVVGDIERGKDRKSKARRYLVEGLNSGHHAQNGRRLYRSHTFNISQGITGNNSAPNPQRSLNHRNSKESAYFVKNDSFLKGISGVKANLQKEDTSKVKKAIDNWNELVLELNTEHYRRLSLEDSETSSNDDNVPSPLHKYKNRGQLLYTSKSILPSTNYKDPNLSAYRKGNLSSKKGNPFSSAGLTFARYRPITPNLLLELEKNKLSSRKKTQRWVNQLEVQSRSYNNSHHTTSSSSKSQVVHESAIETAPSEKTVVNASPSPDVFLAITAVPSSIEKKSSLHRSESYGSTSRNTRISGLQHSTWKPHTDFI